MVTKWNNFCLVSILNRIKCFKQQSNLCRNIHEIRRHGILTRSAVNDILEKEVFTLQELLEEDELLQEVKSRNTALIDL